MNTATIAECLELSFANTHFPDIVMKLAGAGVSSYTADLIRQCNIYYGADGENHTEPMPLTEAPAVASAFDEAEVASAIKTIQRKQLGYADFLRRIMAAGCSHYSVFIDGRKAIYFGRNGDLHVEPFPEPQLPHHPERVRQPQ